MHVDEAIENLRSLKKLCKGTINEEAVKSLDMAITIMKKASRGELNKTNDYFTENKVDMMIDIMQDILKTIKGPKDIREGGQTLTVREAAFYCGMGHEKIRELVEKENTDFPYFKIGSRVAINRDMLDEWLIKITKEHRIL